MYLGRGWNGESVRHSNARRLGRAGPVYKGFVRMMPVYREYILTKKLCNILRSRKRKRRKFFSAITTVGVYVAPKIACSVLT